MKINVLGVRVDSLTMKEVVSKVEELVEQSLPGWIVTANPEIIYQAQRNEELKNLLNSADIITPDGEGVVWASRLLGSPVPERVTGIDLLLNIFPVASKRKWRMFFLGGAPGVAAEAAAKVREKYPGIMFEHNHGYFRPGEEEQEVLRKIGEFNPHVLVAGLGAPYQERWINRHYRKLAIPVSIGVGGSFDVLSGRAKRAPGWVQRIKLEWLARLISQPWRLKRQADLPKFVFKVLMQKYSLDPRKN